MADDAVRATNDDATSCKKFAVQRGYWTDPWIQYFVRNAERRAPEINRGYFARVASVQTLLKRFLQLTSCKCQVINLGAGFDTTYWNLKEAGLAPTRFIDVDFPGVTNRKCYYIKQRKPLLTRISENEGDVKIERSELHSPDYHIVPVDLRNISELESRLAACSVDFQLPTVVLAECVLVYMDSKGSSTLLQWLADHFSSLFFINYEQVNMDDRFGQVMIENLRSRQCDLPGVEHCASLDAQRQRFLTTGWQGAEAMTMSSVYHSLPAAEVQRIEKLEFLDERELLDQLFQHYCLCWSYKDSSNLGIQALGLT